MKRIFSIILTVIFLNCSTDNDNGTVEIRLSNVSEYDFENIIITDINNDTTNYPYLGSNSYSQYETFELKSPPIFITFDINGRTFSTYNPEYVLDKPLKNGKYTYEIQVEFFYNDSILSHVVVSYNLVED